MPYIKWQDRDVLDSNFRKPQTPGELNYLVSDLLDTYLCRKGLNYSNINEVIGVLECAKLELYRRLAAPYEDQKIKENGDVYFVNLVNPPDKKEDFNEVGSSDNCQCPTDPPSQTWDGTSYDPREWETGD